MNLPRTTQHITAFAVSLTLLVSLYAATPNPTIGTAVVDGSIAEWDLATDYFADMYHGWNPAKGTHSKLYLRYDCATETMYALSLQTADDKPILVQREEAWIKVMGAKTVDDTKGNNGVPPDFAWHGLGYSGTGTARGWEASFKLTPGTTTISMHNNMRIKGEEETVGNIGVSLEVMCGSLGNQVWHDRNNSSSIDDGEEGLDGVIMHLLRDTDGSGALEGDEFTPVKSTVTTGGGWYRFNGLSPGKYQVVIPESNFAAHATLGKFPLSSTITGESDDQVDGDDNGIQVAGGGQIGSPLIEISTGEKDDTVDFGVVDPAIGNLVWHDLNANGRVDGGEPGIAGVQVEIFYASDTSFSSRLQNQLTDANGFYFFTGLGDGAYVVRIPSDNFDPGGPLANLAISAAPTSHTDSEVDDDDNGAQTGIGAAILSPVVTLGAGTEPVDAGTEIGRGREQDSAVGDANADLTVDFGFLGPKSGDDGALTIGSLVWRDGNNNGLVDVGESGIGGVTVDLFLATEGGSPVMQLYTTTTTTEGTYFFSIAMDSGNFMVRIPASNFTGPLAGLRSSGTPVALDNQVDDDNNGQQSGLGAEVWSPLINLAKSTEPVDGIETGLGGEQDNASGDNHGDMTVDFGFSPPPTPTAARLAYFKATSFGGVQLTWGTLVESNLLGFRVDRSTAHGGWQRVTNQLIPATGWNGRPQTYSFVDAQAAWIADLKYRLVEVNLSGKEGVLAVASLEDGMTAGIVRTKEGLSLNLRGTPNANVTVESAATVNGPWMRVLTHTLDVEGTAVVNLGLNHSEAVRFYRALGE